MTICKQGSSRTLGWTNATAITSSVVGASNQTLESGCGFWKDPRWPNFSSDKDTKFVVCSLSAQQINNIRRFLIRDSKQWDMTRCWVKKQRSHGLIWKSPIKVQSWNFLIPRFWWVWFSLSVVSKKDRTNAVLFETDGWGSSILPGWWSAWKR